VIAKVQPAATSGLKSTPSAQRAVGAIAIAPVKSLGLTHPDSIELQPARVPGNHEFFLVDADNRLFVGQRFGGLVSIATELDGDELTFRFPDGAIVSGVVADGDRVDTDFYGFRTVEGNEVVGPWSEAVSSYVGQPVRLIRARAGDGYDVTPVSIVSTASIERLNRETGEPVDPRRFRMLLQVDGCEAHEEDTWTRVAIGEAIVRIGSQLGGPLPRCAVITQNPDSGKRDLDTLRLIKRYRGQEHDGIMFGVYASVEQPGRVKLGDAVDPLDR
jgi:uncharacterized protein YcbX